MRSPFVLCSYCGGEGVIRFSALVGVPAVSYSCNACYWKRVKLGREK